jgi:hypothetical protein
MARHFLSVAATTVSVERLFYLARCQAEFNRTYSRETFEALMMSKIWIRHQENRQLEDEYEIIIEELGDSTGLSVEELPKERDTRKANLFELLGNGDAYANLISDCEDGDESEEEDEEASLPEIQDLVRISTPILDDDPFDVSFRNTAESEADEPSLPGESDAESPIGVRTRKCSFHLPSPLRPRKRIKR